MRFIPAPLRKLQALNWGQALTSLGYQRVQLRLLCVSMLMTLPVFPLVIAYMMYNGATGEASATSAALLLGTSIAMGILMLVMIVWLSWTMLKVSVMRWRGLGFKGAGMVGMVILTILAFALINVAAEIGQSPELLLTGMVPLWVFKWLGFAVVIQILQGLLSYWMYLEDEPLRAVTATVQEPYAIQPGNFEGTLLFLQQVWIWFGILSIPMYVLVAHIQNS